LAEVAAIKSVRGKGFGRASKAEAGTPRVPGAARAAVVVLSSVNATAEVFAEAGKEPGKGGDSPAGRRRALLQAPGNDIGACKPRRRAAGAGDAVTSAFVATCGIRILSAGALY
jgi:hypothetical protein